MIFVLLFLLWFLSSLGSPSTSHFSDSILASPNEIVGGCWYIDVDTLRYSSPHSSSYPPTLPSSSCRDDGMLRNYVHPEFPAGRGSRGFLSVSLPVSNFLGPDGTLNISRCSLSRSYLLSFAKPYCIRTLYAGCEL